MPAKVRPAVLELLAGALIESPYRVGGALGRELTGLHSARRGEYRVIYEIRSADREVRVLRVQHRRQAYRPR